MKFKFKIQQYQEAMQRVQIRQTIYAHLDKEQGLFNRGIKCLSLFFIDEVSHYRRSSPVSSLRAHKGYYAPDWDSHDAITIL